MSKGAFHLPFILTNKNKYWVTPLLAVFVTTLYFLTNHNQLMEPRLLNLGSVDDMVPFMPGSFWIYLSMIPLYFVSLPYLKDEQNLNRLFWGNLFMWVGCCIFFLIYPTTFPRHSYPLDPHTTSEATYAVFYLWREYLEKPTNCFPSLHVASSLFCGLLFLKEKGFFKKAIFLPWALVVCFSTLTTKQHYFIDVIAGAALAVSFYFILAYQKFTVLKWNTQKNLQEKIL
ncbi:MAG TPA: phosphatase PAP2 family protein [Bdellovibrionota bacterium]|nr:phosphatase PAP2 family protein [Bdellovibrionota bacterium]